MSALPGHSPIQRLDFDVLSYIFKMNADIFSVKRAVDTTLATSRVCRDWRNLMLGITSIWAQIFDLDHWVWSTAEGRRELVRRSGTALLWMKSHQTYRTPRRMTKVLNVVSTNWERIQKLEVTIGRGHVELWSQLHYLPAPHLETSNIIFPQEWTRLDGIFSSFFGGSAPKLRELRFGGQMPNFTPQLSWLHQLRSLHLAVNLTVSEILEVLMLTRNLVMLSLQFDHPLARNTTSTHPLVSLPKLAHLDLELIGKLSPGAVLLDHMCIPAACSVNISAIGISLAEIDIKRIFEPIVRAISSCARPHFKHNPPQQLWLTVVSGYFILETATHSHGRTFELCVELDTCIDVFPAHTLAMLLSELALPGLAEVMSLDCTITAVNGPIPGFTALMTSLPSVNAITTDKYSLRHLHAWSAPEGADAGPRIGFPALKILKLVSVPPPSWHRSESDSVPDPISEYVMARIARGHAISVIDFTEDTLDVLPHMECLRTAVGLKVLWRQRGCAEICEYVCGTGASQNLEPV